MTHDELMAGFPPAPELQVTLANWQDPQNTAHLVDTLRACGALAAHLTAPGR